MDQLYKEIVSFQGRINASIDDGAHPTARSLQQEAQRLEDEAQAGKNPLSLEDRVKQVIRLLKQTGNDSVMSSRDVNELAGYGEYLRGQLRKLG